MRVLEQEQFDKWTGTKNTDKKIPFVREAKSGGWKQNLPPYLVDKIEVAWFPLMNFLGYELQGRHLNKILSTDDLQGVATRKTLGIARSMMDLG